MHTLRLRNCQQGPGTHVISGARSTVPLDLPPLGGARGPAVCCTPTHLPTPLQPWAVELKSPEHPEFESRVCRWLAVWPWASDFTSLSLGVSIWNVETTNW